MSQSYDRISLWGFYQYDNGLLDTLNLPSSFTTEEKQTIKDNIIISGAELELYYTDLNFFKYAVNVWSKKKVPVWTKQKEALEAQYNPLENYDRNESWTDTSEGSSSESGTHSSQLDRTNSSTGRTVVDSDTATSDSGNTRTVVDQDTTGSKSETVNGTLESSTTDSSTSGTTGGTSTDRIVLNEVMGANPNELWANHDRSTTDEDTTSHSTTTGTGSTSTESETETTTTGSESGSLDSTTTGTESRTGTVATDTTTNVTGSASGRDTQSGTDSKTGTSENESIHTGRTHGNIGVTTSQQMLESEIELRNKYNIMDIIINDFLREFCLRVY